MHKIKKGIKKKIKGKKDKNDEIFTPEELEKYKKGKAEEAQRLAAEEQQPLQQETTEEKITFAQEEVTAPEQEGATATSEVTETSGGGGGQSGDWRNYFAATDTVLKETTDNLVQIKEASYFQKKEEKVVEPTHKEKQVKESAPSVTPAPATGKKWVDLEKGGIDEESEEVFEEVKEPEEPEPEKEPELAPLQFIEDLPDVDIDDFTEVFDTTYVDNVESGEVKLHYIPDSPTTEDPNEPDPFDTSEVDRVLHAEKPKPKKPTEQKQKQQQPEKKKKKLVSLGRAVDVLTGKVQTAEKPSGTPAPDSKRRRVVQKEVDLLADFSDIGETTTSEEGGKEKTETTEELEENYIVTDILCVTDVDIPETAELLCPTPRATSPAVLSEDNKVKEENYEVTLGNGIECQNKEVDLSEFLELNGEDHESKEVKQENGKDLDLKDLVAEFDIIDKSEVINETLIPEDEFDAEFAFLAAESVAKAKEKEVEELEDDPFDTSVAAQVLGPEETAETEKDPFDVGFANEILGEDASVKTGKPPPPRPSVPKAHKEAEEVDPFDTSVADKHLPVDHLASPETALDLPETLQPHSGSEIPKSDSFDPFDTSIAEAFGKTELKVLETALLHADQIQSEQKDKDPDDFDFNPRAQESEKTAPPVKPFKPCLLTSEEEKCSIGTVLTPSQDIEQVDFDPFDTSIATKVAIQSLEAELLSDTPQPPKEKKQPPVRPPSPHIFSTTPTDTNPTLEPSNLNNTEAVNSLETEVDSSFDPFDTSIAENFGKTELKALEDELLTGVPATQAVEVEQKRPDTKDLDLSITPDRPASPKCLLAATPLDEHPTLLPTLEPTDNIPSVQPEDFDPFDTSIADQFGKTELKALESELLVTANNQITEDTDAFNPRAEAEVPRKPSNLPRPPSPAHPQCLLTSTPVGSPSSAELLAPTELEKTNSSEDFDPFDTSIAEKFGKTELKQLESELLTRDITADPFDDFDPRGEETKKPIIPQKPNRSERPAVPTAPCLLATTPTDQSAPLQPCLNPVQEPKEAITPEDFDPFDTTIAEKLCKTEIKVLEEAFLAKSNTEPDFNPRTEIPVTKVEANSLLANSGTPNFSADHFLSSSPTEDLGPTLLPVQGTQQEQSIEFDPFDTSIADKFGKTELKTLESELLSDTGVKRNLSDDEFDPREEETRAPKHPPIPAQKPATPINLLDSSEEHSIPDLPIQASQAKTTAETLEDYDPFDTTIAENIGPSKAELKYLESELLSAAQDPFDTSNIS